MQLVFIGDVVELTVIIFLIIQVTRKVDILVRGAVNDDTAISDL